MKLNKTLALAALVAGSLLAGGAMAQAQDTTPSTNAPATTDPAQARMARQMNAIIKQLELNDDQKTNVQSILTEQMQKIHDIRNDDSLSTDDKRAKYKDLRDSTNEKMKKVLTDDQYQKWLKVSAHRRTGRRPSGDTTSTNAPAN